MTSPQPRIAIITASVREGRIGPVITDWFLTHLANNYPEFGSIHIDLAHPPTNPAASVASADAIVVVTPEYNHSFPGPLKTFIDSMTSEWRYKPMAFVSYGGVSGGLRAAAHLKAVFAELSAPAIRNGVVMHSPWRHIVDGALITDSDTDEAAAAVLDELSLWVSALSPLRAHIESSTIELHA